MSAALLRDDRDGLCTLTLNRPDRLNALNSELFKLLDAELARLEEQQEDIGCVILQARGRAFCAGADLHDFSSETASASAGFKAGVIDRLATLPQTVIVKVHALCYTGGLELALAGDLIVAGASARFADTHGKWGFVAGWGLTQRLPRRIGLSRAKLLMMTGRSIDAAEAYEMGLADICVADEELDRVTSELARDVLNNSWHTNREYKRLMAATIGMSLEQGLAYERDNFPGNSPDCQERLKAFGAKRD